MQELPNRIETESSVFQKYIEDDEFVVYNKANKKMYYIDNFHEYYDKETGEVFGNSFCDLEMYYNEETGEPERKMHTDDRIIGIREIPFNKIPKENILTGDDIADRFNEDTLFFIDESIFKGDIDE
jgi:hypothetical protein